ncbi:MAG: hypothetical protein E7549_07200 [Ruminococcaceae bacterium]|nr:hypothetical protein [Oscillospiraceae bacterium]
MNTTRERLIAHCRAYPALQIQDLFKYLFQSALGCEHAVSSLSAAVARIEAEGVAAERTPQAVEPLDGEYSRVPLGLLSPATLGRIFLLSAKAEANGTDRLADKLQAAKELVAEGLLPFSPEAFDDAAAKWAAEGYPALHHSDTFRETYHPAYRVIAHAFIPFFPLFKELDERLAHGAVTLAVEGGSAAGKSTLSHLLTTLYDCAVIPMDDFFLRPEQRTPARLAEIGGNIDRERFADEVLGSLNAGTPIRYRPFDCGSMTLGDTVTVPQKRLTVVEGVYATHPAFGKYYDLSLFLDITPERQKERITKRNSPLLAKRFFEEWIPMETAYFEATGIRERCDIRIGVDG